MKIFSGILCLIILNIRISDCQNNKSGLTDKLSKKSLDLSPAEIKSQVHHAESENSSSEKDFKKSGGGEYDLQHHSRKGDKGVEKYDKTSAWVKRLKGSHNRKLGDEAKKGKKESSSYSKDPDYYDDSDEEVEKEPLKVKESHTIEPTESSSAKKSQGKKKKYHRKKKSPKTKTAAKVESNLEGQMISMDNIDNSELSDRIEMSPKNEKIVAVVDSDGANMRPNSSKKKLKKSKVGKKGRKAKKIKKEKEVEE